MKLAGIECKQTLITPFTLLAMCLFAAGAQKPSPPAPAKAMPVAALDKLPKIWHSEVTKHDFRVEVTNDLFRAEWVNIPSESAKQGAYIRTECRRAGTKYVGTSRVNMLFAIPNAPARKDVKLCAFSVRFEVDSVSADKITGHSESLHTFDVNACRPQETKWSEFTWVPKK